MKCKAAYRRISALTFLVVHGFLQSLVGKCKAPKNILDWLVSDFLEKENEREFNWKFQFLLRIHGTK